MSRAISTLERELRSCELDLDWAIKHNDKDIKEDRQKSILDISEAIKILNATTNEANNESLNLQRVTNCPLCDGETTFEDDSKCMTAICPNCIF